MTQADTALTVVREIVPMGKSLEISRRSMLGAVAALPAVAIPAVAIAAESSFLASMRESREAANAKFWRLHAELEALEAEWSACPDDEDETERRLGGQVQAKFDEAMMQGVFCPLAVLAKLRLAQFDVGGVSLPKPAGTLAQMIEWDLDRCAKAAQSVNPNV